MTFYSLVAALTLLVSAGKTLENGVGPITKVLTVLKTMQKELEAEAKEDQETYDKLKCWCETNNAGKTQAVQDQKQKIDELNALIETSTGKKAELITEVDQLKKDIAQAKKALAEATEIRRKEAAEFAAEEKELVQSVTLLKGAIVALSKHHTGFVQSDAELATLQPRLRKLVHQNLQRLNFLTVSKDKDAFLNFINANDDILESDTPIRRGNTLDELSFLQRDEIPVFKGYAPQSGQIFGILQQMKEAFEIDLPQIQKEEVAKQEAFALMKGEKESEIEGYQNSIETKEGELANTKETLTNAKSDLKDVKAGLSADQAFLLELTERCTEGDYEWDRRQKMRSDEIEAVSQAIVILDTDEVRDGQQTTFRSFLQTASRSTTRLHSRDQRRARAVALLNKAVAKAPGLALLLVSAKADPFGKVIKAIDALVAKLKVEMDDEVKHKDFCDTELHENQVEQEKTQAKLDNLVSELESLGAKKEKLGETIAALKKDIAETQVQMQRASEDRKMENAEFQKIVADQIRTIEALKAAHAKLSEFYFKNSNFLQQGALTTATAATTVAPSPEFEDYQSNKNSNKIMNLIQKLTGEAEVIKAAAVKDEQNAEDAYVKLVGESNDSIKAKSRAVVDTTEELADTEQAISQATLSRDETIQALDSLAATKGSLHQQCDFILKNFDVRQKARAAEMDALAEVKAILSGMK
jgi:septal ring factor EnvC (AmiA/AmiB activator)